MRRLATGTAVLLSAVVLMLGSSGIGAAVASGPDARARVKAGTTWTIRTSEGGCEVITFAPDTFTADRFGDSGTYVSRGNKLTMTWTAGSDAGAVFEGKYSPSSGVYSGTTTGTGLRTTLSPGAAPDC